MCDILLDMYNKRYALSSLNLMRSALNFFFHLATILLMIFLFLDYLVSFIKRGHEWPSVLFIGQLKKFHYWPIYFVGREKVFL